MGPPFDHTMADPRGHYLFVDVNEHEVSKMSDDGDPDISKMFAHLSISAGQPQSAPTQSKHNDRDGTLSKLIFSWISY